MKLRIGSRGSPLALWQAHHVAALLCAAGHEVEIEIIKTTGDRLQDVAFVEVGTKAMFTMEIEDALAAGRIDLAVHSLKDLPTELADPFILAATPPRADSRDVLVSISFGSIATLPLNARVGTSSSRRHAQLKAIRPDLDIIEFRGNVDTRLRKLGESQADAILLAAAGLDRLEKTEWLRERLDPKDFCPAPGQGALGIETRKDDTATFAAIAFLDHAPTRFAVTAERAALQALGGGCQVPIGIHCRPRPLLFPSLPLGSLSAADTEPFDEIFGIVADPVTGSAVRIHHSVPHATADPVALGQLAAQMLIESGAGRMLEAHYGGGSPK